MSMVLSIANQKGGVGKTTTAVALATYAAWKGHRTLLIDNDPQGNASSVFLPQPEEDSFFVSARMVETALPGLSLGPSSMDLLDRDLRPGAASSRFPAIVAGCRDRFDVIIIDCPPSLNSLPREAFRASDRILIPLQCEYYAMEGLSQILSVLAEQDEHLRPKVNILLTMFDPEIPLCRDVAREVSAYFPQECLAVRIPRDSALAVAPSHRQAGPAFDPLSPGSLAYAAIAKELFCE